MSNDLISRDALKKAFEAWKNMDDYYHDTDCDDIPLSEAYDLIDNIPTVTPDMAQVLAYESGKASVERATGEWICTFHSTFPQYEPDEYRCSKCNGKGGKSDKFCKHCGAKMKKEAEND